MPGAPNLAQDSTVSNASSLRTCPSPTFALNRQGHLGSPILPPQTIPCPPHANRSTQVATPALTFLQPQKSGETVRSVRFEPQNPNSRSPQYAAPQPPSLRRHRFRHGVHPRYLTMVRCFAGRKYRGNSSRHSDVVDHAHVELGAIRWICFLDAEVGAFRILVHGTEPAGHVVACKRRDRRQRRTDGRAAQQQALQELRSPL